MFIKNYFFTTRIRFDLNSVGNNSVICYHVLLCAYNAIKVEKGANIWIGVRP